MDAEEKNIQEILQQAPLEATYEDAKKAYEEASKNVPHAISLLWELPPLPEKPKKVGENADKWDEIRDICDEFDREANRSLSEALRHNREQQLDPSSKLLSIEE